MMSNVIPNITVDDPYHRRVNDEIIAFGQVMDDAAYRALVSVPLLEVSAAVTFSQECPSNGKVCPVRIKANVNVGGPVKLDLFLRRPEAYLYNIVVVGEDRQAKGVGRSVLMRVLANIAPLGFTIVSAGHSFSKRNSGKPPKDVGYYALATWGFDADLPAHFLETIPGLPAELVGTTRLSELISSKRGKELWKEYGDDIDVDLPLATPGEGAEE